MPVESHHHIGLSAGEPREKAPQLEGVEKGRNIEDLQERLMRNKEMYHLSGFPDITGNDIQKYIKSNEQIIAKLPELIERGLADGGWDVLQMVAEMIQYVPKSKQLPLQEKLSDLIQQGLADEKRRVRQGAVEMIQYASEEARAGLIQQGFADEDEVIRWRAAEMIQHVPESKQPLLREKIFDLIQQGFANTDEDIRWMVVGMIKYASEEARAGFIQQGLAYNDWSVRQRAAEMIQHVPESKQPLLREKIFDLIQQGLAGKDSNIRYTAVVMIKYASEEARAGLIQQGLVDEDWRVRQRAIEMIQYASEEARDGLIQQGFANTNGEIRWRVVGMIKYASEEARAGLIQQGLVDEDWHVRQRAIEMIQYAREEDQKRLRKLAGPEEDQAALQKIAGQTPLYKNDDRFFRKSFEKSGSKTTLLDVVPGKKEATFREKVIIRHIDLAPYLIWKKAFESCDFWQEKGFDYVPIEPIIRVRPHGELSKVDVFTRVLQGPAIATWQKFGGSFVNEIDRQKKQIIAALEELGIHHGHLHDNNFVLYFPKNKDGEPDISRPPRVYVIDFDMAESKPTK